MSELFSAVILLGGVISVTLLVLGLRILRDPNWEHKRQQVWDQVRTVQEFTRIFK